MASKTFHKKYVPRESEKGLKCEGKILAYKKNKKGLITILQKRILIRSVLSGLKLMHVRFLEKVIEEVLKVLKSY